jgi:hypothetical protein
LVAAAPTILGMGPRFRFVLDIAPLLGGLYPAATSVGPAGDLWVIARDRPRPEWPGGNAEARGYWYGPQTVTIVNIRDGGVRQVLEVRASSWIAFAQPLPNGEVLLVRGRTPDGASASVVDARGTFLREFTLGDAINHVQTTLGGDIWVSYFDEGVFGGRWDAPDGRRYENSGLLRATPDGEVAWTFAPPEGAGSIDDCYALNVSGDGDPVWACYYSDFPVVRIARDGHARFWRSGETGVRAIAVAGDRIVLGGGYAGDRGRLLLGRLSSQGTVADIVRLDPAAEDGGTAGVLMGSGPVLHRVDGTKWYQLSIEGRDEPS